MDVYGIMLAAGSSSRMNDSFPKLTLPFRQKPLLWWSLKAALKSNLKSVLLVVGANKNRVLYGIKNIGGENKFRLVENENWEIGRSSSVTCGLRELPKNASHVMFLQGDQPLIGVDLINRVIEYAVKNPESPMLYPSLKGKKANPVVFSKEGLIELSKIEGDTSGFGLSDKFNKRAVSFELEDNSTQLNINTNSDYRKLIENYEKE
ncbi:MAG: nucleotidyltransferase family protein [Candidatus Marinimicrobia bacterium]|nr:nucleotidyltransferase family protein [Candidatus Neomarinimicrobiota bacterium]